MGTKYDPYYEFMIGMLGREVVASELQKYGASYWRAAHLQGVVFQRASLLDYASNFYRQARLVMEIEE